MFVKPTPTHYLHTEGGNWLSWHPGCIRNMGIIVAVRFDDTIFDLITGEWRMYHDSREIAIEAFMNEVVLELRDRHCTSYCSGDSPPRTIRCNEDQFKRSLRAVLEWYETIQKKPEVKK